MQNFPNELIFQIAENLNFKDFLNFSMTRQRFKIISEDKIFLNKILDEIKNILETFSKCIENKKFDEYKNLKEQIIKKTKLYMKIGMKINLDVEILIEKIFNIIKDYVFDFNYGPLFLTVKFDRLKRDKKIEDLAKITLKIAYNYSKYGKFVLMGEYNSDFYEKMTQRNYDVYYIQNKYTESVKNFDLFMI
ncbi:MAG: hypothetical protein NZZ41_07990, partial [Candidatus Dojkabacteria bacterium]|nr:hypothetical protein [Candidatus Dojkabacteria bacterium]